MNRVKEILDRQKSAKLDKNAVARFVKHALWEPGVKEDQTNDSGQHSGEFRFVQQWIGWINMSYVCETGISSMPSKLCKPRWISNNCIAAIKSSELKDNSSHGAGKCLQS